jgi:hypothetical protein
MGQASREERYVCNARESLRNSAHFVLDIMSGVFRTPRHNDVPVSVAAVVNGPNGEPRTILKFCRLLVPYYS